MEKKYLKKVGVSMLLAAVLIVFVLAIGAAPDPATASEAGESVGVRGAAPVIIRAGITDTAPEFVPPPARALAKGPETATITVNYIGVWDAQAQMAFQHAVDIWETQITSSVPIIVNAEWENLGGSVLGSAGAEIYFPNFTGAPIPDTMYAVALANSLAGVDLDPGFQDINASFNSAFPDWYFGTDGNVPGNKWDFVSVVLHEIGHGLGFSGSMRVGGSCGPGLGCWGLFGDPNNYPVIYDRFTENGSGTPLLSFTNFSAALAAELTGDDIFFNGPLANAANSANLCQPPKLFAPGSWQQGSSYSHLDESTFNGTDHALMTPTIFNGEANHDPGAIVLGLFGDMAWDTIVGPRPLGSSHGQLFVGGPTPTATPSDYAYLPAILRNGIPCLAP